MKNLLIIISIIIISLFSACSEDPATADEQNHPPTISSLVANPDTTETEATITLTCIANDSDGDILTFVWDAGSGAINGSGSNVNWVAPNAIGSYYVSCKVVDGNGGEDVDSVNIVVIQQLPSQGLVAYYPFNGNANDQSGNGNNGTVFGAILTLDRFGNSNSAYSFDGNDYIKADADDLPTAERTTSLWFNASTYIISPCPFRIWRKWASRHFLVDEYKSWRYPRIFSWCSLYPKQLSSLHLYSTACR